MLSQNNRLAPLYIICFWGLLTLGAYFAFNEFFKPTAQVVSSTGDLILTRERDGHFYADGSINQIPVRFLLDTGASLVVVSESFAQQAGLTHGEPTTLNTANGSLAGYVVKDVLVTLGPMRVSGLRVGVGHHGQREPDFAGALVD
jgi:aspartyl protease family protein